ncbi:uncharacterized protein DUF2855 [Litorimonas taeanensis]|uniref:Uncharacterized protein DUF2855 n=1 Tax=Litorimonas taeanensis TaxID=568099 RepID=A0A420WM65_9PROT|nr:DUF2855 family protein [Litorimonas taeanensis]RKQ72114.1 uncharacterized protein DUF2855 [Litorimonas taeanensis]
MTETLLVNTSDFADVTLVNKDDEILSEGFIRCKVGPWALTANNVTYMVTGHTIGYWHYFDPNAYGISTQTQGRMPVWGYAEVIESRCDDVEVGKVIYGFLPITQTFDMKPTKLSRSGFEDGNDHRVPLHSLYNRYTFIESDPSFGLHKDLQPVLRPLFTTSFLIDDFLDSENYFGAEQVLILSASSKTALGTAYCAKALGAVKVTALTSENNKAFTQGTGFYDLVETYDSVTDLNPDVKTVIVDMSGNTQLLSTLIEHFEENLTYVCRVGLSHWDAEGSPLPQTETPIQFFFAPDQAKKRIAEWGGAAFAQKMGERWVPFLSSASEWLTVEKAEGASAILKTYKDVLNGNAMPDKGFLFTL